MGKMADVGRYCGQVCVAVSYDELPFGGVKSSGVGREHGSGALDYHLEAKRSVVNV